MISYLKDKEEKKYDYITIDYGTILPFESAWKDKNIGFFQYPPDIIWRQYKTPDNWTFTATTYTMSRTTDNI